MPLHRTPWWRLRHLGRGHQQASFCNGKRGQGSQIAPSHQALRLPASRAEDRPPNCTRGWWGGGLLGAAGPGRVGPSLAPGGRSICPHVHLRRPGRTAGGARRSRPRPSDPSLRGGRRGRGAAARPQAEPDPRRAPRRLRGGSGRPDAPATVAVNTSSCPGELFQQAGKDRYFEWQATPFLTPRIDVAPAALMGA